MPTSRNREERLAAQRGHTPPLDVAGAAAYLGTTERHVRRLVQERRIRYYKLGGSKVRLNVDDLDAWLAAQRIEASA